MTFPLAGYAIGAASAVALYAATGTSLGLWLGGFAVVAGAAPALAARPGTAWERACQAGAVADCVVAAWLLAGLRGEVGPGAWLACTLLLYLFMLSGVALTELLGAVRVPRLLAATGVTLALAAWLTMPVWASAGMDARLAGFLSDFHPLLAVNGQVGELGIWLEQGIVYRHTSLGQDVPYALPDTIWRSAALHAAVAIAATAMAWAMNRLVQPVASPAPTGPAASP
jgi:hypothetical protein